MNQLDALPASVLYAISFCVALAVSLVATPLFRLLALRLNVLDRPITDIKTHRKPVPYLGGLGIAAGWVVSLFFIRMFTDFPTGTLHSLRGIIAGCAIMLLLGLVDDIAPRGLHFRLKFAIQIIAALLLVVFGININFIQPAYFALILSVIWIIGVTNALNIIDIMDGLSSGIAVVASLAFLFIALPTEQIYVNFCAAALAGACLGFMPFNLSARFRVFMGDAGSLMIGFVLAALSLGTSYTRANDIGLFAPLLILAIPIYDTILVMILRMRKGMSPFLGSKDHFALRLEVMGFSRHRILMITYTASVVLAMGALLVTRLPLLWAGGVFVLVGAAAVAIGYRLSMVPVE